MIWCEYHCSAMKLTESTQYGQSCSSIIINPKLRLYDGYEAYLLTCVSLKPIIYTIFQYVDIKHASPLVLTWQQISKTAKDPED